MKLRDRVRAFGARTRFRLQRIWFAQQPNIIAARIPQVLWFLGGCLLAGAAVVTTTAAFRLWSVPGWYLDNRNAALANAIDKYRSTNAPLVAVLVQATGGILILAGLYLTWRQLSLSRLQQVRDAFSRAIDHLGNDRADVRVAALHVLERTAVENPTESEAVARVVEAFLRDVIERAAERLPATDRSLSKDAEVALEALGRIREAYWETVVARARFPRPYDPKQHRFVRMLEGIDLRWYRISSVRFVRLDLTNVDFFGSHLTGCSFESCQLRHANFASATLGGVRFSNCDLTSASFAAAKAANTQFELNVLTMATFDDADLTQAVFRRDVWTLASAQRASLTRALVTQCDLNGVKLEGADVTDMRLIDPLGPNWNPVVKHLYPSRRNNA